MQLILIIEIFFLITPCKIFQNLPQIFNGASSSSKMGCDKNISLDLRHNPLISFSESCTFFPGREPRTENKIVIFDFTYEGYKIISHNIFLEEGPKLTYKGLYYNIPSRSRAIILSIFNLSVSVIVSGGTGTK